MESHDPQTFHLHHTEFDDSNFQIRGRTLFFAVVLLCSIILIALLYLYARWVCHFPPSSSAFQWPQHTPPQAPPSQGLDPGRISRLPTTVHRASSVGSEAECSICLGIFQEGEKVKVLPDCHHCYHSECVDKWLNNQSSCPLCRASLRVVSLV